MASCGGRKKLKLRSLNGRCATCPLHWSTAWIRERSAHKSSFDRRSDAPSWWKQKLPTINNKPSRVIWGNGFSLRVPAPLFSSLSFLLSSLCSLLVRRVYIHTWTTCCSWRFARRRVLGTHRCEQRLHALAQTAPEEIFLPCTKSCLRNRRGKKYSAIAHLFRVSRMKYAFIVDY